MGPHGDGLALAKEKPLTKDGGPNEANDRALGEAGVGLGANDTEQAPIKRLAQGRQACQPRGLEDVDEPGLHSRQT
ncbi:MAG TPA: hypothetical protein VNA24_15150 [Hyalangium sp.]|nr:hypothetical protein [Hyalangium sp.]